MLSNKNISDSECQNVWYQIYDTKSTLKNEFQDVLSTEDCLLDSFEKLKQMEKD